MVDRGPLEAELRNLLLVIQEDFPLVEPREAQEIKTLATQSSQNLRSLAIAIGAHSEALLRLAREIDNINQSGTGREDESEAG